MEVTGFLGPHRPVAPEKAVIANPLLANSLIAQIGVDRISRLGKFASRCETGPVPQNLGLDR
jgi:hypothetical protein